MWLDITTYLIQRGLDIAMLGILVSFSTLIYCASFDNKHERIKRTIAISVTIFLLIGVCLTVPTHDRLFQLKVSKIKNEIATKTNLDKLLKEVNAIANKLASE